MKRLEHVAEQVKLGDSKESRKKILQDRSAICMYVSVYVCMKAYILRVRLTEIVLPTTFKLPLNPHLKVCMYACMYVCMYVNVFMWMYVNVCMWIYVTVCMYVSMYVCTYVCMYVQRAKKKRKMHISIICMYVRKYACIFVSKMCNYLSIYLPTSGRTFADIWPVISTAVSSNPESLLFSARFSIAVFFTVISRKYFLYYVCMYVCMINAVPPQFLNDPNDICGPCFISPKKQSE